tara:strand:- start:1940 stop:2410 length:471 start_codon:yes stop_codon:yes gene_type:complete
MISIKLNGVGSDKQENIFYLSLKDTDFEISNLVTNTYLLVLTNDYTKKFLITMINPNLGNTAIAVNNIYAIRLTDFSNTTTVPDATLGQTKFDDINLPPGSYSYEIYQQNSRTNLKLDLTLGIIETGKAFVTAKVEEVQYKQYTDNDLDTNITYVQ